MTPESPTVFLHIPKTGGTSFGTLLQKMFPARIHSNSFNDDSLIKEIDSGKYYKFYSGHYSWASTQFELRGSKIYTILRDPIQRTLSQFKNFQDRSRFQDRWAASLEGRRLLSILGKSKLSFKKMLTHQDVALRGHFSNVLTRSLLPFEVDPKYLVADAYRQDWVDLATYNLFNKVEYFGILELMDLSLMQLSMKIGAPVFERAPHLNNSAQTKKLSDEEHNICRQLNLMDQKIYESAKNEFLRTSEKINKSIINNNYLDNLINKYKQNQSRSITYEIKDIYCPEYVHSIEYSGAEDRGNFYRGTDFRWFGSSPCAFYLGVPWLPRHIFLHTLLPIDDPRIGSVRLSLNEHVYIHENVFPTRTGSIIYYRIDEGVTAKRVRAWKIFTVALEGRDEIIETPHGMLPYLIPIHAIEVSE